MNIQELIVNFLKEKMRLIDNYIGKKSNYVSKIDLDEVMTWSLIYCIRVIEVLGGNLSYLHTDSSICPWCNVYNYLHVISISDHTDCKNCQYGTLHGYCKEDNSLYEKITAEIQHVSDKNKSYDFKEAQHFGFTISPISRIPGMQKLVCRYNHKCKQIINTINNITV